MALHLQFATHSEIGLVRKNNQDSGYASPHLLVVADGMGGAAAGDLASAVAVDTIRALDSADAAPATGEDMLSVLSDALRRANERIAGLVGSDFLLDGMGTTLTGALFDGTHLGLAHIGDSRAYRMRGGTLERLTHDHSWVQSLVDEGKISEDAAAVHPHRSLLLRVLNGQPANDADLTMVEVEPGDRFLFCSDGLCGLVDDDVLAEALRYGDSETALRQLTEAALAAGGMDNITIIVADVAETESAAAPVVLGAAAERTIPETRAARAEAAADEADEDTLIHRHPLAVGGSAAGARTGPDEERYLPQAPAKRRGRRTLVALIVFVLIAGAGLGTGYAWTRTQFFVGPSDGQVAIFRGLHDELPGISLSTVYEVQPLLVSALPPYYQDLVRESIAVATLDDARATVAQLTAAAQRCADEAPSANPPATPGKLPPASPTTGVGSVTSSPPSTASPKQAPSSGPPATPEPRC